MQRHARIPFKDLDAEAWKRLALMALVVFYVFQLAIPLIKKDLFNPMGFDFLGFWSAGRLATQAGYAQVYDLQLLRNIQVQQLSTMGLSTINISPYPTPFFSVFIVPFQLLSFFDATTAFLVWSIISLTGCVLYMTFFISRIDRTGTLGAVPLRILIFMLLSYELFLNLYWGQVEVFLLICCGEFIRNAILDKPLVSGLWLGGMLLKPQVLILVLPAFLLLRNWRLLAGFILALSGILVASIGLSGPGGLLSLVRLWLDYAPGLATNAPEVMTNWRMLEYHLWPLISPVGGWIVVALGMTGSLIIWYFLWRKKPSFGTVEWITMAAGLFAISCAFTWHSHLHMMAVVIPFLIYASIKKIIPNAVYEIWVFAVPAVVLVALIIATFLHIGSLPINSFGGFLLGGTGLAMNLMISLVMMRYKT